MFGGSAEAAATASHARGVTVKWLVSFAETFGCWDWPTFRVMQLLVQPGEYKSVEDGAQ